LLSLGLVLGIFFDFNLGNRALSSPAKTAERTSVATDQQITGAKAKGIVWVNTSSNVYHKQGSIFYGKTWT